jgi:uracil-DNA glycosylase family 4
MEDRAKADLASEISAAIDWWRDAGVDCDFGDEPTRWLKAEETRAPIAEHRAAAAPPPATDPAMDRSAWPQDLAAFTAWWLSDPALDEGRVSGRVPPRGNKGAELLVIVPDPEREDAADDGGRLLSGPQGRLLDAMLAAMGIAGDAAYVASVLPRHMPMADWAALAERGFGALLCHHIRLAAPRRIIALGSNILSLLGHDPAHSPAVLRDFNQDGVTIPLLAGKSLSALLERPRWKAGLWQGWLDWTR